MFKKNKKTTRKVCKYTDKTLSKEKRKQEYEKVLNKMLNPVSDKEFDPETFDPMKNAEEWEIAKRNREEPPCRLPTLGMKPKRILRGQMVGMFESKQDLYLLIAHVNNTLLDKIEAQAEEIKELKTQLRATKEE